MGLVFVEFKDEIDAFLKYVDEKRLKLPDFHIVALSLEAQIYLRELNIDFHNTLKFFNNESHKSCLLKSGSIVQFMEENVRLKNNPEEINGYKDSYIFYVRHVVNYVLWVIEVVSNAIAYFKPDSIIVFDFVNSDYSNPLVNNNERYSGELCRIIAKKNNISIDELKIDLKNENSRFPVYVGERKVNKKINRKLNLLARKKTVLVTSLGYNIDSVCSKIKKWDKKVKVVYFSEGRVSFIHKLYHRFRQGVIPIGFDELEDNIVYSDIEKDLSYCFDLLGKNKSLFEYRKIEYWELIKHKILNGINTDIKYLVQKSNQLSFLIQNLKPNLTVSYSSRLLTYNLGEICRNNNLEALCISHGTVVPPKNEIEEIVNRNIGESVILNRYPSVAVQTPWCEKFLNHYEHESKDIITGPLIFRDDVKRKKIDKEKVIVHAVTLKTRFSLKFWGVETHDEFISSITSLIETVEGIKNTKLIIRLHPAYRYILSESKFKNILPASECYSFSCRGSIYDVLCNADLLVSFSSTTIEEALLNKIPVLLYDNWNRYRHFDAVELDKEAFRPYPVYYARDDKIMRENLPLIMERGLVDNIDEKEWLIYIYPKHCESNFYGYLNKCFNQ